MARFRLRSTLLAALLAAAPAATQNQDLTGKLLDRIVANETAFLVRIKQLRPILETYIQEASETPDSDSLPNNDHYLIGRLDLRDGAGHTGFAASSSFQKRSRGRSIVLSPAGFAQMVVPDAWDFNRQTYGFQFVDREFLGEVRCLVFDVAPTDQKAAGKFIGRIWVEDKEFHLVRFNGTYTQSKASSLYFHFDSWRVNVAPGFWAPAFVYIEEAGAWVQDRRRVKIRAQSRLWGYNIVPSGKIEELTNILIEAERPVRDQAARDVSPVESQREWKRQAEENVIRRLEKSGLLAPKGEVDQVLNTVINNLMVTNDLNLEAQCRVLLTTPLETFSVGRTIVISRGLLDVLPDEASLAVVLSEELAHIALGHRTETMYAFGDVTMFAERETLSRMRFSRTPQEIEAANKTAVQFLSNSPYKEKLVNAGLFLKAVSSRAPRLPHLIEANLGNQLAGGGNLLRLAELAGKAPALDENKIEQVAALPLGSRIRVDPWTNRITLIKTKPVALLSPREKMPFEVTPFMIHLTRVGTNPPSEQVATSPAHR